HGLAVISQHRLQTAILLVGINVGEHGQFAHLLEQDRAPLNEVLQGVALDGVLKLCAAPPSADAHVLSGLHKSAGTGDSKEFWSQTVHHLAGTRVALIEGFQTQVNEAAIGGPAAARERHDILHGGIRFDDTHDARRSHLHGLEGNVLRALYAAEDNAIVLLREESFGDDPKKEKVKSNGEDQNGERQPGMFQDPTEAPLVAP